MAGALNVLTATAARLTLAGAALAAATPGAPTIRAGTLTGRIHLDGVLDEPEWASAPVIEQLTMSEPTAGGRPSSRTTVRVLASPNAIVIGIVCEDPDPSRIVSFTKQRDAALDTQDHVAIVFDTFLDGRSGYLFEVNPSGARYDALVNPGGADANANWDAIWDAGTHREARGWSAEIWIPAASLAFKRGLTTWHFNVERRIQRRLETDRWSAARPDWTITQTSRAGLLTGLPDFSVGLGLTVRPAGVTGGGIPSLGAPVDGEARPSLDVWQRIRPSLNASASINTDFAETEVDTRRTNLTRFPLFFPEKRTFFLEGSDLFAFGLGLSERIVPFFSRQIGLISGQRVPIAVGGKINGRVDDTSIAAVVAQTRPVAGLTTGPALGAFRVKQDVLGESAVGAIGTFGDPGGGRGSWLVGSDFTYQTSHFHGDKNLRIGVSGEVMNANPAGGDHTAAAARVEYPNDLWSLWFAATRIGDAFQPALGFVPRAGIYAFDSGIDFSPRFHNGWLHQAFPQFEPTLVTDLHGRWESYEVFTAPVNWRFESGDHLEFDIIPEGERLALPFNLQGVAIPPGAYQWQRYRLEAGSAAKRRFSALADWWFGGFYSGSLNQFQLVGTWNASDLISLDFSGERDLGALKEGHFTTTLTGVRLNVNVSPHLQGSSFIQFDTTSASLGSNSRLRWTITPVADLFMIYNHNLRDVPDRWQFDSNEFLVKFQYAFRY